MEELRFQITDEMEDERIDKCMSLLVENLSRSFIQKLIKDGNVLVNGTPVKGSCRVKCDDEVVFSVLNRWNRTMNRKIFRWISCMKMRTSLW